MRVGCLENDLLTTQFGDRIRDPIADVVTHVRRIAISIRDVLQIAAHQDDRLMKRVARSGRI